MSQLSEDLATVTSSTDGLDDDDDARPRDDVTSLPFPAQSSRRELKAAPWSGSASCRWVVQLTWRESAKFERCSVGEQYTVKPAPCILLFLRL